MLNYVIFSENIPASAITNITKSISDLLQLQGNKVEIVDKVNLLPPSCDVLVNLKTNFLPKLFYQKRFCKIGKIINVFTPNFIEFQPHEIVSSIMLFAKTECICPSPTSFDDLNNFCMQYLSMEMYRDIMSKVKIVRFGIEEIFEDKKTNNKNEFVVPFVRVNETQKNISLHSKITTELKKKLPKTNHTFFLSEFFDGSDKKDTSAKLKPYTVKKAYSDILLIACLARKFGFFVSTSKTESFGLYYIQLIKSGVIGVFVDHDWVHKILPDYPFVFNKNNIVEETIKLYNNYESSKKKLAHYIELIEQTMTWENFTNNLK